MEDVGAESLREGESEAKAAENAFGGFSEVEAEYGKPCWALLIDVLEGDDGNCVSARGHTVGKIEDLPFSAADAERS